VENAAILSLKQRNQTKKSQKHSLLIVLHQIFFFQCELFIV
jgi:hypothetical protein